MSSAPAEPLPTFIPTKPFRQFVEFCTACRRQRSIGLCFGAPGVGKTASARRVATWDQIEPLLPFLGYSGLSVLPSVERAEPRPGRIQGNAGAGFLLPPRSNMSAVAVNRLLVSEPDTLVSALMKADDIISVLRYGETLTQIPFLDTFTRGKHR